MPEVILRRRPARIERGLVWNDIHFPYHDPTAIELAIEFAVWFKPHIIWLNGDIIDFYAISRFDKDPNRQLAMQDDIDMTIAFLGRLRGLFPDAEIIYREGNHEARLQKF